MSTVTVLHEAVRQGDLEQMRAVLAEDRRLANSRSDSDARGTYPLHVAAEFGQAAAARLLLEYGADVSLLDTENDAIPLCWAAFFGRPDVVAVLLEAGSDSSQAQQARPDAARVRCRRDKGPMGAIFQRRVVRLAEGRRGHSSSWWR